MTQPTPATLPANTGSGGQLDASGQNSAVANYNPGVISTGDRARITQLHLPSEALTPPADVPAPAGLNNLPLPHSDVFVGRDTDMTRLRTAMTSGTGVITQVVRGLGGVGKTTLALHYAHQQRDTFDPVWWITAETLDSITADLADLALHLNPYLEATTPTTTQAAAWATTWLQTHTGWLLILDNSQDPQEIGKFIGPLPTGHHLITTRRATGWHHIAPPLELDTISPEAAVTLLERITGQTDNAAVLRDLAAELGYLPLALEQAAAYIRQTAGPADRYLTRLRDHPARMFATPANGSDRDRTIARIWSLTLDTLTPLAGDILRTLAWVAPEGFPRALLYGVHDDEIAVDEALGLLNDYSTVTLGQETVTIHRLVQAVARTADPTNAHRSPDAIQAAHGRAVDMLDLALPGDPKSNVAGWPQWRVLLPHVEALITATDPADDTEAIARILNEAAIYLRGQGQIAQHDRALADRIRVLGDDHPSTLNSRNNLAGDYELAGDLGRAIPLYERTLADCTRVLGDDHPLTRTVRANLADAYAALPPPNAATQPHDDT